MLKKIMGGSLREESLWNVALIITINQIRTFCNTANKSATERAMHQEGILGRILSADAIKVNASLGLPARFPDPDGLGKNVFRAYYKRQMGIDDIARAFSLSITEIQERLKITFQLLNFILSA